MRNLRSRESVNNRVWRAVTMKSDHRHRYKTFFAVLIISGGLWCHPCAARSEASAAVTNSKYSRPAARKLYLHQIDQQLKDLEGRTRGLRAKERSLTGPERDRLSANVRMLKAKLHDARRLWVQLADSGDEWLKHKKDLDARVIRIRKSFTYISNISN